MRIPARPYRLVIALLLIIHSAGCQSGNTVTASATDTTVDHIARADALLAQLPASGTTRQQRLLSAARLYASDQAYAKASAALNLIDTNLLDRSLRGDFLVTATDAALASGDIDGAWRIVTPPPTGRFAFVGDLTPVDFARVAERRATLLEKRGQVIPAVRERIAATSGLPRETRPANIEVLWSLLTRLDTATLRQLTAIDDMQVRGWASLATVWKDTASSPAARKARLAQWVGTNKNQDDSMMLPSDVRHALDFVPDPSARLEHIAVLLPSHGKLASAGEALQRGLVTAWFDANSQSDILPDVHFYDTARGDFAGIYDSAVNDGAQLVVGPLEKENLKVLTQRSSLPVPTLALNFPDSDTAPENLYFLGLAGEDEAIQIAHTATSLNLKRAVLLAPAADWGQRIARQFEQTLTESGGHVQARSSFQNDADLNALVESLLDVAPSQQRHDRLAKLLGIPLGFEPRSRQDIDFVVVIANTPQAMQISPAIQYHYGGGFPVLATSNVNSQPAQTSANDLEGLQFLEMPWIADTDDTLRAQMTNAWRDLDARYIRLNALGVDAWRVLQIMPGHAASAPTPGIAGVTGTLTMDSQRRFHRELTWMRFHEGVLERVDAIR